MRAFHSTDELHIKMKELESMWKTFVDDNCQPDQIRHTVYQSWKRCQSYGVDPRQKRAQIALSDDQLAEWLKKSRMYQISLPILHDLATQIDGTGHLITLCDKDGRIIYLQGDAKVLREAEKMNFVPGADWSEKTAGTNAIGTSIATGQPIQILSFEHFCEGCHPWVCSSAPIKEPLTGQLIGVIDLTGPAQYAQPHTLGIAMLTSLIIQQRFAEVSIRTRQYLLDRFTRSINRWKNDALVVLDAALQVVDGNPEALSLLQIDTPGEFWTIAGMNELKTAILNGAQGQNEFYLPSLRLQVFAEEIVDHFERAGFLLRLQRTEKQRANTLVRGKNWSHIIGESPEFLYVIRQSQMVAPANVPVLITGESGTGKEQIAQSIHKASPRCRSAFIAVNCGAIPKELIASELFGYDAGTFTGGNPKGKKGKFEEANGGTLFLDEIGEMPLDLQVHLLRVLQEKEVVRLGASKSVPVDVRVIAATNQNLSELIQQGKFRPDLYYRLNVVELHLPPLRERGNDILLLCNHFARLFAEQYGKSVPVIDGEVLGFFREYHWPGNIREFKNVMEYAVLFSTDERIRMSDLPNSLQQNIKQKNRKESPLESEEKKLISRLIREANGNLSEVARRCNIARTTLYRKMNKYNIRSNSPGITSH